MVGKLHTIIVSTAFHRFVPKYNEISPLTCCSDEGESRFQSFPALKSPRRPAADVSGLIAPVAFFLFFQTNEF